MTRIGGSALVLLLLLLLVGGCSAPDGRDLVAPTTTTTTSSTAPVAITVGYLNGVIDQLDHVVGEAFRELVRDRGPNARFVELLDAVYDGQELEDKQGVYGEIAADDFANVRPDPGDPVTSVRRIIKNEPNCIIVAADRTFAAFYVNSHEGGRAFLALKPSAANGLNATGWSIVFDGGTLDDVEPTTAC